MVIFGFLTLGIFIGWLSHTFSGAHGMQRVPSMITGALGALIGGVIVILFDLKGSGVYAGITSILILFTINTFRKKKAVFKDPK